MFLVLHTLYRDANCKETAYYPRYYDSPNHPPASNEMDSDYAPSIPDPPPQPRRSGRTTGNSTNLKEPVTKRKRNSCTCPPEFKILISDLRLVKHNLERVQLFVNGMNLGIHRMCHNDLRNFVKLSIGLNTNAKAEEIMSRARLAFQHRGTLDQYRNDNYAWFNRSVREIAPAELLEPFRFISNTNPEFTFEPLAIIDRIAGIHTTRIWEEMGNLIVSGLLSYIYEDSKLYHMIAQEFDIYQHHFQPHTSKPKMGFLRNMFFSLTQQMIRQDPALYALNVACRPSHEWRLVSYPYVAKKVVPGEKTGFAHTDVNIDKWVKTGHGANQLTCSVSLDYEKSTDCTEIVPGFHKHAAKWNERLEKRGTQPTGTTTNAVKLYLPEDEKSFGSFVPQICKPGDVRITQPEIIHGSTPNATIKRRVIYPWFTGIKEDHHTLEIPGQLSWSEVAACHRDQLAPRRGVGGDAVAFSCPIYRFAAGIHMPSSSALSDALIGRRSWEDPEVLSERDVLLGPDVKASQTYIRNTQKKLVSNFKSSYAKMVEAEKRAFGINSFFNQTS